AQHADTQQAKLQVELAQLRYTMPRLQARDDSLSRLTGGIGGRGPGETKLEVDRRRVRDRIARLERELKAISTSRQTRRRQRNRRGLPTISIVGYTNAGKSTLLNALTRSDVFAENKLFATLDPTSRRLKFPRDREVLITDTVGFIRDLPRDLKAAFKATLEELEDADLLLHVIDAGDANLEAQKKAVESILEELGLAEKPRLLVFNKSDLLDGKASETQGPRQAARAAGGERRLRSKNLAAAQGGVAVSALTGAGLTELLQKAGSLLFREGETPKVQMSLADV
ncbi:MAG: GTPase HflX, partial [Myxococcota bacterium]